MKSLRKWTIGALVATTLISGSISLFKNKEDTPKRETVSLERTISFENPQRTLDETFRKVKPEHISEVIYDPNFTHSDNYLRKILRYRLSEIEIEPFIQNSKRQSPNHILCVTGIISDVGDNNKRPVFARANMLSSSGVLCNEDLESSLYHEDIHAEEERRGYDFGDKRLNGYELTKMFNQIEIRAEVILGVGEFDAYSSQLTRIKSKNSKVSSMHIISTTTNASQVYNILENGTLKPMEKKYFEAKKKKHAEVIETIKRFNSKN